MGQEKQSHSRRTSKGLLGNKGKIEDLIAQRLFESTTNRFFVEYRPNLVRRCQAFLNAGVTHVLYHTPGIILITDLNLMNPSTAMSSGEFAHRYSQSTLLHPYSSPEHLRAGIEGYFVHNETRDNPMRRALVLENLIEFYKEDHGTRSHAMNSPYKTPLDEAMGYDGILKIKEGEVEIVDKLIPEHFVPIAVWAEEFKYRVVNFSYDSKVKWKLD